VDVIYPAIQESATGSSRHLAEMLAIASGLGRTRRRYIACDGFLFALKTINLRVWQWASIGELKHAGWLVEHEIG
jgi:hypothetical protein